MQRLGEISLQDLASLGKVQAAEGEPAAFGSKMLDADGDGRFDLFLMDGDNDGVIDGVVRGFDSNGDGVNDVFAHYNEDGTISSIGRLNPGTGELEVIYEEPGFFDELLESLGLAGSDPPDEALFTSFDDPYILETYGSFGEQIPEEPFFTLVAEPADILETGDFSDEGEGVTVLADTDFEASLDEAGQSGTGKTAEIPEAANTAADETGDSDAVEHVARVTEIRDAGGGVDGSTLWARVDTDGDSQWDREELVSKSGSAYLADIDRDGYSEEVASDLDGDSRIDSVDTTGRGSSTDKAAVSSVIAPDSGELVDRHPGEDDAAFGESAEASTTDGWQVVADDDMDAGTAMADTSSDDSGTDEPADTDAYSSTDTSGTDTDVGSSDSYDAGTSTDIDSGTE